MKRKVNVDAEPEMAGALGAALLALRRLEKIRQNGHEPAMKQEARVA
ncbi:MAG: hypothetical protein HYS67_06795 [Deltaproteobacteria bacterium]|nr:hypothetical protein [Deltaproteobacteria bacterium]